jgi:hypothetical protein
LAIIGVDTITTDHLAILGFIQAAKSHLRIFMVQRFIMSGLVLIAAVAGSKMNSFLYSVQRMAPNGECVVEYTHRVLGKVVKQMILPLNKTAEEIERAIIDAFPRQDYYSRLLERERINWEHLGIKREGEFKAAIEPDWYVETAQTLHAEGQIG